MPFDGTMLTQEQKNLVMLIGALREESKRPKNFHWDFSEVYMPDLRKTSSSLRGAKGWPKCGSVGCAMGLAAELGITEPPDVTTIVHDITMLSQALGITYKRGVDIFGCVSTYGKRDPSLVTPDEVAAELEKELLK